MINRPVVACILTLLLVVYLCFTLSFAATMEAEDTFADYRINISDSLKTGFVSAEEIARECGDIDKWISKRKRSEMSIGKLEQTLRNSDKIEDVNVCVLNNGTLNIDVVPMTPVARVFDGKSSYYINAQGKKISADPRYHIDVPVVVGYFTDRFPPQRLLPMLEYIAGDPSLDALVSTLTQERNGDIFIVPTIRGHVVNFGDTSRVVDKFENLQAFYRKVMPVRGWETYDTISVKWRGQVVASRRNKTLKQSVLPSEIENYDDVVDAGTMSTDFNPNE